MPFEALDDFGNRCIWSNLHLKVDMVPICIDGDKIECGIFLNQSEQDFLKLDWNKAFEIFSAVLGSPNKVILMLIHRMAKLAGSHEDSIQGFALYAIHPRTDLASLQMKLVRGFLQGTKSLSFQRGN